MPVTLNAKARPLARDVAAALSAPLIALVAAELIHSVLGLTRLGLLFLAGVTVAATMRGGRAAVFAALISVLAYKFFLDLRTADHTTTVEDVLNLAIFLVVALITGTLAGRVHDEAAKARRHAERMELLFRLSRTLSEENEDFWPALIEAVSRSSGGTAVALDANGNVRAQSGELDNHALELGSDILRAGGSVDKRRTQGWSARAIPSEMPVEGVLLWENNELDRGTEELIELVAELGSASLARSRARQAQVRMEATQEAGKLREALLSSISHDFRSPLSAIIGSSTSLLEYGDKFNTEVRRDLLLNIRDEGERLNQFVANLLDMTKLQSGVVRAEKKVLNVAGVISAAAKRITRHHPHAPKIEVDADCAVAADPLLLEQAIYNILDNAVKYAATTSGIRVTCTNHSHDPQIIISDHGPGLPEEDQAGVFTTFHFTRKNGQASGTGLGLSISRGFVEAMGGTIEARDRSDGHAGLEVAITLPASDS